MTHILTAPRREQSYRQRILIIVGDHPALDGVADSLPALVILVVSFPIMINEVSAIRSIEDNVYNLMNNGDIRNKSAVYYKDAWFANNPTGTFTGPGAIDWSGYMWAASNSEMVEDGSFLKMNNLAVTFRMPKNILKAWKIKDLALTYTINNVFCLTNYSGYDPEVRSGSSVNNRILPGVDISAYPYARSHIFSLNFKY